MYDAFLALELAYQFFLRGIDPIDAVAMFERIGRHQYPKTDEARIAFQNRAKLAYDKYMEQEPESFGRMKGEL